MAFQICLSVGFDDFFRISKSRFLEVAAKVVIDIPKTKYVRDFLLFICLVRVSLNIGEEKKCYRRVFCFLYKDTPMLQVSSLETTAMNILVENDGDVRLPI